MENNIHYKNEKNNNGLKAIVAILALLLSGSLYYTYTLTKEAKLLNTEIKAEKSQKEIFLDSLNVLKETYDLALEEKTTLSEDLIAEREKVVNLISDLKKSKGDTASMSKYRTQFIKLQENLKVLMVENNGLKKANEMLTSQRDSTINIVGEQKKFMDTLATQNKNLSEKIEKGAKLVLTNLSIVAIKEKSSGKQVVTEKASRANRLKVCFTIAGNELAKSGEKMYYVQIIDANNNVIGDKKTEIFGDFSLTYSFITKVVYANKNLEVCEFLVTNDKELTKGSYFVNVFDKGILVSKSTFDLK